MSEKKGQLTEVRLIERTADVFRPSYSPDNKPLDRAGFSGKFKKNEDVASWIEKSMHSNFAGNNLGMWPEKLGNVAMVVIPIAWQLAFTFGSEKYAVALKAWKCECEWLLC